MSRETASPTTSSGQLLRFRQLQQKKFECPNIQLTHPTFQFRSILKSEAQHRLIFYLLFTYLLLLLIVPHPNSFPLPLLYLSVFFLAISTHLSIIPLIFSWHTHTHTFVFYSAPCPISYHLSQLNQIFIKRRIARIHLASGFSIQILNAFQIKSTARVDLLGWHNNCKWSATGSQNGQKSDDEDEEADEERKKRGGTTTSKSGETKLFSWDILKKKSRVEAEKVQVVRNIQGWHAMWDQ